MDSSIHPARNDASLIPSMSDVPATKNKERIEQGSNSAAKNIAVVQCDGFRCLAYREGDIWRDFQTGKELPEVSSVIFTFSV
jgi:hypothetical protein